MGTAKLYGMNNAYIPNSKADMHHHKKVYQRGREVAERDPRETRTQKMERRRMSREKAGAL